MEDSSRAPPHLTRSSCEQYFYLSEMAIFDLNIFTASKGPLLYILQVIKKIENKSGAQKH